MVFGVNVAGKNNPPSGHLDVWIPTRSLAEATSVPDADIRQALRDKAIVLEQQNVDCWIRLKKADDAHLLIGQLQKWVQDAAPAASV
jgi:hypothetical protein